MHIVIDLKKKTYVSGLLLFYFFIEENKYLSTANLLTVILTPGSLEKFINNIDTWFTAQIYRIKNL